MTDYESCPVGRELRTTLAVVRAQQREMHEDIQEIKKHLLGNGRPGMLENLAGLSVRVKVIYAVLGALGSGLIAIAGRLLLSCKLMSLLIKFDQIYSIWRRL